jgi:hypothetical protein
LLDLLSFLKLNKPIYSVEYSAGVVPFRCLEGVNMKAKPCPGIKCLIGETEKMKEVAKGRRVEEFGGFVGTL